MRETRDLHKVLVEIKGMVLKREYTIRVEIALLRKRLLQYFPLNDPYCEQADFLFSNPVVQQTLMERVQKALMMKGLLTPNEGEVAGATLEACFSGFARAHMGVPSKFQG